MLHFSRQSKIDGFQKLFFRLIVQADQNIRTLVFAFQQVAGYEKILCGMRTVQPFQFFVVPRLQPDTVTVYADLFIDFHLFFIDGRGIDFQRNFRFAAERKTLSDLPERARDIFRVRQRRRAAAEINRVKRIVFELFAAPFHFPVQTGKIRFLPADFLGKGCKIAICTFLQAKRYMHVNSRHLFYCPPVPKIYG